jgi:CheY-like chemotaxis protein
MYSRFLNTTSPPPLAGDGTYLILSVDDEPTILSTRQLILEGAGYQVLSAADGNQALRLFCDEPVDLVLLDYVMPGIDGGLVAHQMKQLKRRVPILLVSASPVPEDTLTCIDYRCDKGQGPLQLLEKISEFLTSH